MSPGFAIGLYYFAYLGAVGVWFPFIPLYLKAVGLPTGEVTRVMALGPLAGLAGPILVGLLADFSRARVWLLRASTVAALLFSLLFLREQPSRAALYLTMFAFAFSRAPLLSITDAVALDHSHGGGAHYGQLRLWGSLGFLLCALAAGWVLDGIGVTHVLWGASFALACAAVVAFTLPAPPPEKRPSVLRAWGRMLSAGPLWFLLAAVMLGQLAGAAFDGGFSLYAVKLGLSGKFVGIAWAIGVAVEVVLMWFAGPILERVGAERMYVIGQTTAMVRWLFMARATTATAILVLQPLHAVTFGMTYVSAVHLVRARGGEAATAAQGLFATAMMIGSFIGMSFCGTLLERAGGRGLFGVAAGVSALAAACALGYSRARAREVTARAAAG